MSYRLRYLTFFILDSAIVLSAIFMSYYLLHPTIPGYSDTVILISAVTLLISHHVAAYFFHLYDRVWSVASVRELLTIGIAVTISVAAASGMQYLIKNDIYFRVMAITWMLHIIMIGGSRFLLRLVKDHESFIAQEEMRRVLIVGAGQAGTMLARNLQQAHQPEFLPVAFVDDDPRKQHLKIMNITVQGKTKDIERLVERKRITDIIIAIPSLGRVGINSIYEKCAKTGAKVKIMPKIEDVMTGKVSVNDMQDVRIEDLLGREEVKLDLKAIADKLTNKTILVTGAGGSIGSEICRQVLEFRPKELLLLGHGESSIYNIDMELRSKVLINTTKIIPIIADIQDRERIFDIVSKYNPDVIYHAAAHKHVPLMESNPMEAVKNNIFGTKNVAEAADAYGIKHFVLVSTDKAVNPPNVMGSTKRFAEMIIQNLAKTSETKFAAVRFGNVLGSRGSVVPLFKNQIARGGPVTVTDPNMTRYFMTIPEASKLVIQAGTLASGGEVFVLDMGEPVKIVDLAKNMIRLSGYSEHEIEIRYSGIRPGEKLYEELLNENERQSEYIYPKIYIGKATPISELEMNYIMEKLVHMNDEELKETLVGLANRKVVETKNAFSLR
ncbi:UDP-N-acetylglucosamine 4,6-dehydratase [Sporosarcina sp. NCCP-2222]|uniref:polysaccharide biosynthesis protein n=1 Tax=Sporosarcina sp. NCCP-2222 TaxID=2935073 RepID=UPI00208935FD|nr:nucleoside-diphosphate sugar epimerase/dehydratase [Sporosarcina sp. NCCP-2222]GKV57407.1 UDP-N-acetylglucosamine 4,6-dehydratase [Sporosarcina sp. NCCP-2222]